jgi:hypothetical protein
MTVSMIVLFVLMIVLIGCITLLSYLIVNFLFFIKRQIRRCKIEREIRKRR